MYPTAKVIGRYPSRYPIHITTRHHRSIRPTRVVIRDPSRSRYRHDTSAETDRAASPSGLWHTP